MDKNYAYENSEIIFENDRFLIVRPWTEEALTYFNAKWARRWIKEHKVFIIVDKEQGEGEIKPYVIIDKDDRYDFYDETDEITSVEFFKKFPELENVILEKIIGDDNIYSVLVSIIQGKQYTKHELNRIDDLITQITYNKNKPKGTIVTLTFDDRNDFYTTIGLSDDDIGFLENLFGNYSDLGFFSSDSAWEDWKEGYIYRQFNQENKETFKKIANYLWPNFSEFEGDNGSDRKFMESLENLYQRYCSDIMDDYQYHMEQCYEESAKEGITDELGKPFEKYGFFELDSNRKYVVPVSTLINLFDERKVKEQSIRSLLNNLVKDDIYGGFWENMYEYGCYNFDSESFNRSISSYLDSILENVEEGFSTEFMKVFQAITEKYEIERWYDLKREPGSLFMIRKINPDTAKILILYRKKGSHSQERSYTLEEFYTFLNNPELF